MNAAFWTPELLSQYDAIINRAAWVRIGPRTEIEITGRDRMRVMNNFCTADLRPLKPGDGTEAFVLSPKGTTLGHVGLYIAEDRIHMSTVSSQAEPLVSHIRQYVVSEVVDFADVSQNYRSLLLAGPGAGEVLARLGMDNLPTNRMSHVRTKVGSAEILVRRTDLLGANGFECVVQLSAAESNGHRLSEIGVPQCGERVLETVRIENRLPLYGIDIDAKNLPQEIGRNSFAISFNKGCYLGQETVARLDSLGHVNRHWVALVFDSTDTPAVGPLVDTDEKPVARVTSATWSPSFDKPLALAYVRDGQHLPGTRISTAIGQATVLG